MPVELRGGRRPGRGRRALLGGLEALGSALPCSSIQPRATISSRGRCRCSGVMMPPGCTANARTPRVLAERVEVHGEQAVGRLRLAVGLPLVVAALEHAGRRTRIGRAACGRSRTARRRARRRRRASAGHSRLASAKWPRWLVANCASQPGPTRVSGAGHDRRVVDEHVERAAGGEEALGEGADAVQVAEVERVDLDRRRARPAPRAACCGPAGGHDDLRARRRASARDGLQARGPSSRR